MKTNSQEACSRPNVLIILADQHRADCIGAYGNKDILTPNIDKLAMDSVTYTNSFCPFPICTPSRYSLLTGLYVHQHLGWNNHCTMPQGLATFPRVMQNSGYKTKAVGKMHFTPTYLDVGFQEMVLAEQDGSGRYEDDYHRTLMQQGLVDSIDLTDQEKEYRMKASDSYWENCGAATSNLSEKFHSTTWIADRAVEEMEDWQTNGHLLMVGFIKPHHPFDPPEPWSEMYNPDELTVLPGWLDENLPRDLELNEGYFPHKDLNIRKLKKVMANYYASISQIDYHVGRMIELLKRKGLYDDTMIIYTSDHGEYMGFHHLLLKNNYLYDPVVKVPLIIKYPHGAMSGTISDQMVSNTDLAPTILPQAGLDAAHQMKGDDLSGKGRKAGQQEVVFAENLNAREYMVRSKKYKLLLQQDDSKSVFFDLEKDPLEMENLYLHEEYREQVEYFKNLLYRWLLFDSASVAHLDENAPRIKGKNVPSNDSTQKEARIAYFQSKMNLIQKSHNEDSSD